MSVPRFFKDIDINSRWFDLLSIVTTSLFILAGILVSVHRFWQYEVFYYNFGVFDQAIWNVSRFRPPIIEHILVGGKISLADHFDLSILLFAPLFWLTERSEVLLIVQAIFAGVAGFVIYKIGVEVLKDKVFSFAIACSYFFFIGIQNAVITDFHELTIMSLPISLTFYAIVKKNIRLFWFMFLLTLGYKEVTFALGIGIAIFMYFYLKDWKKHALVAASVSALWGVLTIYVFIPYFSQGVYLHQPAMPATLIEKGMAMVDHPLKRETVFYSLLQFGFLPLFSPALWPVIVQDYALRFIPLYQLTRWSLGLHYNGQVSPLLAIGAIFGAAFLQRYNLFRKLKSLLALLLILNAFVLFRFVHHGPFLLATNPAFYQHSSNFTFLDDLIAKIPKDASVMTQNNLGVRFTHQRFIFLRENYEKYKPDYILLDLREGQNPNNFLFAPNMPLLRESIKHNENYFLMYTNGEQYLYRRK